MLKQNNDIRLNNRSVLDELGDRQTDKNVRQRDRANRLNLKMTGQQENHKQSVLLFNLVVKQVLVTN